MLCKNGSICYKVTIFSLMTFFPACTLAVYDNVKCQDRNRDKLAEIHAAQQHLRTSMLTYKIKVSVLEYFTLGYTILGEQDVEWNNRMSMKVSQREDCKESERLLTYFFVHTFVRLKGREKLTLTWL